MAHVHGAAAPCNCYVLALALACLLGAVAWRLAPDDRPPAGLLAVTQSEITGEVIEWWIVGPDASARERDLRAVYGERAVVRAGGTPPQAAAWVGPHGERLAADEAVTFRYRMPEHQSSPGGAL